MELREQAQVLVLVALEAGHWREAKSVDVVRGGRPRRLLQRKSGEKGSRAVGQMPIPGLGTTDTVASSEAKFSVMFDV